MNRDPNEATPAAQLRSFIARLDPKGQKLFRSVRAAVRKRFPGVNELAYDYGSHFVVAYSPTHRGIDAPVALAARPDGVQMYFNHGKQLPDPKKLLSGTAKQTRFLWVKAAKDLAHPDVEALIAAAARVIQPSRSDGKGALAIRPTAAGKRSARKA